MAKKENKNRVSLVLSDYLYEYVVSESELLGMPMNAFISKVIHDYKMSMLPPRVMSEDEMMMESYKEHVLEQKDMRILGLISDNQRLNQELKEQRDKSEIK